MSFYYLLKSWLLGFALAAPIGPVGMLCIRKTLERGMAGALAVAFGATLGDILYGFIAAFSSGAIAHFSSHKIHLVQLLGGIFLLYFAARELRSSHSPSVKNARFHGWFRFSMQVFILTLANPMTILPFISIFANMSVGPRTTKESFTLVAGIGGGALTWWLLLGSTVTILKSRLPDAWLRGVRYLSALTIGGFGIWGICCGLAFFRH
jgi:putative LysE/RhtB family amino acid efflux pump